MRLSNLHPRSISPPRRRSGSVLIVVLVVIGLLTLGAYSFSEFMLIEAASSNFHLESAQSRHAADSGVELVASYLADRTQRTSSTSYSAPTLFQNQPLGTSTDNSSENLARFSIVSPDSTDPSSRGLRFGLVDESSKINLNALVQFEIEDAQKRQFLMGIPGMTEEISDAILDWIDSDAQPRSMGAEQDAYDSDAPQVKVRNGPLESLDELLLIRGVTPDLLFGEDLNRNGLLDPNENDGATQLPLDNVDAILQRGWTDYLTINSNESNLRLDQTPKININSSDLGTLFTDVEQALGFEAAKFIIAYRTVAQTNSGSGQTGNRGGGGAGGRGGRGGGGGGGNRGGQSSSGGSSPSGQPQELVGGIDISGGGKVTVASLYELIGKQMTAKVDGKDTTLKSPWENDPAAMPQYLPTLFDTFSIDDKPARPGRININQAPQEVMMNIPGLEPQVVQAIVSSQDKTGASDSSPDRQTAGWLVSRQLVTLAQMIELDPFLTTQGDVYRFQVVGYNELQGPMVRLEAILDASELNPKLLKFQDLSRLGSGFTRQQLGVSPP